MGKSESPRVVRMDGDDRIIRYSGAEGSPVAGLWVEVRALRTGRYVQALLSRTYWADLLPWMAEHVVGWNVEGDRVVEAVLPADGKLPERTVMDVETGPLPPPAETGADALAATTLVDPLPLWEWIRACLVASAYHRDDDGGKASEPSGGTPDGTPSGSSDATETTTRKKRSGRTSRGS